MLTTDSKPSSICVILLLVHSNTRKFYQFYLSKTSLQEPLTRYCLSSLLFRFGIWLLPRALTIIVETACISVLFYTSYFLYVMSSFLVSNFILVDLILQYLLDKEWRRGVFFEALYYENLLVLVINSWFTWIWDCRLEIILSMVLCDICFCLLTSNTSFEKSNAVLILNPMY